MSIKEKKSDLVKSIDLPARLKEYGYDIDAETVYHLPGGGFQKVNREGVLKDGVITEYWYYNLPYTIAHLERIAACNLTERLRERGYEIEPGWINNFPYKCDDQGTYTYDLEQIIAYLNTTNYHNIEKLLHERGYTFAPQVLKNIISNCRDGSQYNTTGFFTLDIEKAIHYSKALTENNVRTVLKEHGYEVDFLFLEQMEFGRDAYEYHISYYEHDIRCYNLQNILAYIKDHPPRKIIKNMKDEINHTMEIDSKKDSYFSNAPSSYYESVGNISTRFPVFKWYVEKYKTIPDYCLLGNMHVKEIINEPDFNIRWSCKIFSDCNTVNKGEKPSDELFLREFETQQKCEYVMEALIEVEDGMFIMITEGTHNDIEDTTTANCHLIYKEGVHDPTDVLLFVSDKRVQHTLAGKLGLLFQLGGGFQTQDFTIPKPSIDFNLNYNEGFEQVHNEIVHALSENEGKGLVLLHGKPGTGKTTYIRYLINQLGKNKIFVPPNLTEILADPGFTPFLMNNPDCVLFIEDAENVLRSREDKQHNQAVSNILNITDGLLSDCLNIQVVATFNTNLKNVDPALLRKGRLITKYEFTELQSDRAEKLADSLKVWLDVTDNLTLAEIYEAKGKGES